MTSKVIFYYSLTGKTEAVINKNELENIDVIKINKLKEDQVDLESYDTIVFGTPTYGRGVPPEYFLTIINKLHSLKGKRIGLFGSGNTIYGDDFCGALDVLEQIFQDKNEILFKYKFEGYPRETDIKKVNELILEA
ncbi:flavodoxin family protein [Bacillus sp. Wb]